MAWPKVIWVAAGIFVFNIGIEVVAGGLTVIGGIIGLLGFGLIAVPLIQMRRRRNGGAG